MPERKFDGTGDAPPPVVHVDLVAKSLKFKPAPPHTIEELYGSATDRSERVDSKGRGRGRPRKHFPAAPDAKCTICSKSKVSGFHRGRNSHTFNPDRILPAPKSMKKKTAQKPEAEPSISEVILEANISSAFADGLPCVECHKIKRSGLHRGRASHTFAPDKSAIIGCEVKETDDGQILRVQVRLSDAA